MKQGFLTRWKWNRAICLVLFLVLYISCSHIEDQQPKSTFETETGPLPGFQLNLDSTGSQTIRFDSIAQGGNFSLAFTPMKYARIRIVEEGKAVQIQTMGKNWDKDSTRYKICKNGRCREGDIVLRNRQYIPEPVDTTDTTDTTIITDCVIRAIRTFNLPFLSSVEVRNLVPSGAAIIDSAKVDLWSFQKNGDSTITFIGAGGFNEQDWAWDTLRYQARNAQGQCYKGKIAFILGDTCEPHARNDLFFIPSGNVIWPESVLTANDRGCQNTLGSYQTRTQFPDFDYGNYLVTNTPNGVLIDTLIQGQQNYKYRRTNPLATQDSFVYYFKNISTGRVTKAWVTIKFN